MEQSKEVLNVEELSELLTVKPKTIRQWVSLRKIPFFHIGRLLRFNRSSILEWSAKLEIETQEKLAKQKAKSPKTKAKAKAKVKAKTEKAKHP